MMRAGNRHPRRRHPAACPRYARKVVGVSRAWDRRDETAAGMNRRKARRSAYDHAMNEPLLIEPRRSPLVGGLIVRRALPNVHQRTVGPFVFFDHFGPVELPPQADTDVAPHPHIGLATVTYLLEGEMLHRDSLGSVQTIVPGDINWMSAGSGIVHSERTPERLRGTTRRMHGLQLWVALPQDQQDAAPSFQHAAAAALPQWQSDGAAVRVLVGSAFGTRSPIVAASPTLYLDVRLDAGARFTLPQAPERAIYAPPDRFTLNGHEVPEATMAVLPTEDEAVVVADTPVRFLLIGGAPLAQPVHIWWNFVGTDAQRIEAAAARWSAHAFPPIPGDSGYIEMPAWKPRRGN